MAFCFVPNLSRGCSKQRRHGKIRKMDTLTLKAGPRLVARRWQNEASDSRVDGKVGRLGEAGEAGRPYVVSMPTEPALVVSALDGADGEGRRALEEDVTAGAHEWLFTHVALDSGVTLGDVFRLLDACPILTLVFAREYAVELCGEARFGAVDARPREPAAAEGIEYLELSQQWSLDTARSIYSATQRLQLHGVGFELKADAPDYRRKRGERIRWSVSLTPLRELLSLPLRINEELCILEDDIHAKAFGNEVIKGRHPQVTLGQVLHGVLWELSFHGGPQGREDVRNGLGEKLAEIEAGFDEPVSRNEAFEADDQPGFDAMFDDFGGLTTRDVGAALRQIDDHANVARWLDRTFEGRLVVKAQYRALTGREFRKAFRAATR